ncbi:hypothetical protein [Streptococcus halotolerans]|uniref:hypothetical protein n=1 Tax=Streptococcus halotolerans TaxID=1814128 RepID=UPI00155EA0D6|nr:hypothetical protein [Streptococcus halotolerans]
MTDKELNDLSLRNLMIGFSWLLLSMLMQPLRANGALLVLLLLTSFACFIRSYSLYRQLKHKK